MATLNFDTVQDPADFTPDYVMPTGFIAGETGLAGYGGDSVSDNAGWISATLSGAGHYAEITWPSQGNSDHSRGPVLVNSSGDGYLLLTRGTDTRLFLLSAGGLSELDPVAQGYVAGDTARLAYLGAGQFVYYKNGVEIGSFTDTTISTGLSPGFVSRGTGGLIDAYSDGTVAVAADYTARKGSTFTATHSLGTAPDSVTINGLTCSIANATTTTVDVTVDAAITTSDMYNMVIADTVAVTEETQTVQVNVIGVSPSNNPIQKDGVALGSISSIEVRILNGSALNGTELYYSATVSTDASGNLPSFDLSDQAINDTDPVLMLVKTAAGDSIIADETAGLI